METRIISDDIDESDEFIKEYNKNQSQLYKEKDRLSPTEFRIRSNLLSKTLEEQTSINFFYRLYETANDEKQWENKKKELEYTEWNIDLEIDCRKLKQKIINSKEASLFIDNPLTRGKVTPIGLLACQNKNQAVSFLLSLGSSPELAIQGYQIGGHLSNEKQRQQLLLLFSDGAIRKRLEECSNHIFEAKSNCLIL